MVHYPTEVTTSESRQPSERVLQYADRLDGRFALWAGPACSCFTNAQRRSTVCWLSVSLGSRTGGPFFRPLHHLRRLPNFSPAPFCTSPQSDQTDVLACR